MRKIEKTNTKSIKKLLPLRAAWITVLVCSLLVIGITSALSSPFQSSLSAPITGWSTTESLPIPVAGKNAIAHDHDNDGNDDYVFFVGGRGANGLPTTAVYAGAIGADGAISNWATVTPLPVSLFLHSLNATDTHLFVLGGWKGAKPTQQITYSAEIRSNGTLGPWVAQPGLYPVKVSQHGSAIVNNFIYGIGGWKGDAALVNVNYAPVNSDGSVGTWRPTGSLPGAMRRVAVASVGNKIYVTGGYSSASLPLNTVYVGTPASDGTITQWTQLAPLPQAMFYHQALIHDGNLVVLGGKSVDNGPDLSVVYSASVNADGTLGNWVTQPSFPQGRFRFAAASASRWGSDYIFVLGGGTGLNASPNVQSSVFYSSLPATPTPTPTATPTPTPTPPVSMDVKVANSPGNWVAPGETITYVIEYTNNGPGDASDTVIQSTIPEFTEFVVGSAEPSEAELTSVDAGGDISWSLGTVKGSETGRIEYEVRRIEPDDGQQGAIDVELVGPTFGLPGQPLTYTLNITNLVGGGLGSTTVNVKLQEKATYLGSSNGGTLQSDRSILWVASGLPAGTWSLTFALSANASFVIHDYEVKAQVIGSSAVACCGVGTDVIVTKIDEQPVIGPGDGIVIVNEDVRISWNYNGGVNGTVIATRIQNPRIARDKMFLPYVTQ